MQCADASTKAVMIDGRHEVLSEHSVIRKKQAKDRARGKKRTLELAANHE